MRNNSSESCQASFFFENNYINSLEIPYLPFSNLGSNKGLGCTTCTVQVLNLAKMEKILHFISNSRRRSKSIRWDDLQLSSEILVFIILYYTVHYSVIYTAISFPTNCSQMWSPSQINFNKCFLRTLCTWTLEHFGKKRFVNKDRYELDFFQFCFSSIQVLQKSEPVFLT